MREGFILQRKAKVEFNGQDNFERRDSQIEMALEILIELRRMK
jgi:hypothetical protein